MLSVFCRLVSLSSLILPRLLAVYYLLVLRSKIGGFFKGMDTPNGKEKL